MLPPDQPGYNDGISTLAGDIFVSEVEYPRYVPGRAAVMEILEPVISGEPAPYEIVRSLTGRDSNATAEYDLENVGEYERIVFSCIAWGRYHVYCVIGEMGSGKTSMLRQLETVLTRPKRKLCEQCRLRKNCDSLIVRVDLNGLDSENPIALAAGLRRRLYASVSKSVREFLIHENYIAEFVHGLKRSSPSTSYALFDEFCREVESDRDWKDSKTRRQKTNALFAFISKQRDAGAKLELVLVALRFIVERVRRERACAVLMIDNLDKFDAPSQMALLKQTLSLQKNINIKTLIALRPTNFVRLKSEATMAFGVIVHSGPSPLDVVRARIEQALGTSQSEPMLMQLTERVRNAVLLRLKYVLVLLRQEGAFADTLSGLAGNSSRLALTLMERVLVNSIMKYDEAPANQGDVIRALLVGKNPDGLMSRADTNVANVFTDGQTSALSMVCLRIMAFLFLFRRTKEYRNPDMIVKAVAMTTGRKPAEVVEALRYLMFPKRPLVWAEGRTDFDSRPKGVRDLKASSDPITLTVSGIQYFEYLITSINYVQDALGSLTWGDPLAPAGSSFAEISVRFSVLRKALRLVLALDEEEYLRYRGGRAGLGAMLPPPTLISSRIIHGVSRSALRILEADRPARGESYRNTGPEIAEWLNLLLLATQSEQRLSGSGNKRIDVLLQDYDLRNPEKRVAHEDVRQDPSS